MPDEIVLAEIDAWPAAQATALLAATVQTIGGISPIGREHVRGLTIGDRERLLLALYAASFGGTAETVILCGACGAMAELPLDLDAMLDAPASAPSSPEHSLNVRHARLRLRLLTGADQERAARLALTDPDRAAEMLRRACIVAAAGRKGALDPAEIGTDIDEPLEAALRSLDPWAETIISVECPNCGGEVRGTLDALSLLSSRLGPPGAIPLDVDRLARAYHWSEEAILALPTARRQRYLALLDRAELAA